MLFLLYAQRQWMHNSSKTNTSVHPKNDKVKVSKFKDN